MSISRGDYSIGMSSGLLPTQDEDEGSLPPFPQESSNVDDLIAYLVDKFTDVETVLQGKVDKEGIITEIQYNDQGIKIQAEEIVLVGAVTIAQIINEQNGTTTGQVDAAITRIVGDRIQTGTIQSNNYSSSEGTAFNLDTGQLIVGGSADPVMYFDGTGNATFSGTVEAALLASSGFLASPSTEGVGIDLNNELVYFGGEADWSLYYDGAGNLQIDGTLVAGLIQSPDWSTSDGMQINLTAGTLRIGGSSNSNLYYDGAGNLEVTGDITGNSQIAPGVFIDGTSNDIGDLSDHADTTGANPHNTSLSQINGDLSDIDNGGGFFKTDANEVTGAGRAYEALDSSFDYIRALSTQKIVVSGSNPSSGMVIDDDGLRGYKSGSLTIEIPTDATATTFSGDIVTSGQMKATGTTNETSSGVDAAIVGVQGANDCAVFGFGTTGIYGYGTAPGAGVYGFVFDATSTVGAGVQGTAQFRGDWGGVFENLGSSPGSGSTRNGALWVKDESQFDGEVTIADDLIVNDDVYLGSSSVDSVAIGGATMTGGANLSIKEGSSGSQIAGQISLWGDSFSGETMLGIISEIDLDSGSYSPSFNRRFRMSYNGTDIYLYGTTA